MRVKLWIDTLVAAGVWAAALCVHGQTAGMVGTWATALVGVAPGNAGATEETYREVVHVSLGSTGHVVVTLTNELGTTPLTINAVSVARRLSGSSVQGSVPVLFKGKPSVTIPAGKAVTSDVASLTFPAMSDVAVSLYVPAQPITTMTMHSFADATNYMAAGDQTSAASLDAAAKPLASWRFLKRVDVEAAGAMSIVCLGDSITDGSKSTKDANLRWPDLLAQRLQANAATRNLSVLNEGIGGNRVLHDGTGPSAVARFDRDVLDHPNVKYVILLEGINDIGHAYDTKRIYDVVNADELIAADKLLVTRAHAHGIKVIGATLTPYGSAGYMSPQGEVVRQALNAWIRSSKDLDGVIDFEKAAQDPANTAMFLPAYDSGDHLHPNDAGMKGMADAIDLKLFTK